MGATIFQTGEWQTPFYVGVDPAGTSPGTGLQLPDRIGQPNLPRSDRVVSRYFDPGAFVCPGGSQINGQPNLLSAGCPLSTPENVGRFGNSSPATVEGPGINTWNLAIIKRIKLPWREMNLELAGEFANPWNHPTYERNLGSPGALNLSSDATVARIVNTRNDYIQPWSYGSRKISLRARLNF